MLFIKHSVAEAAEEFGMNGADVEKVLQDCRKVLFQHRQTRPKPHRDDKIMTAWNGNYQN